MGPIFSGASPPHHTSPSPERGELCTCFAYCRLLAAVVLLLGASSLAICGCLAYGCVCDYYVRLFCLLVPLRLLRAVDLLVVFAYYVRLFCLSVRLRSICICFAYIGASSLTMCVALFLAAFSCFLVRLRLASSPQAP